MKLYVQMDENFNNILNISTTQQGAISTEVILEAPVLDFSKIKGYKLILQDSGGYLLSFSEEKYKEEISKIEKEQSINSGNKKLEELVEKNILRVASDTEAYIMRYLYPEWNGNGVEYEKDDRFMYNNKFYKVLQKHTSQLDWTPNTASSLYVEIPDPNVEYPEYKQPINAETAYKNGDKVTYKNKKYLCIAPDGVACTWSPEEYPSYWQLVEEETE